MAETLTIARPYAEAAFARAQEKNALPQWSDMLELAASVASSPEMRELIGNPKITAKQLGDLFIGVCGERLSGEARNFVQLLIENHRLALLPEIHELYERSRAEQEGTLEAVITSAFPLADAQVREISERLRAKYQRQVQASVQVDQTLIGGVSIQVGDQVIDASVRGKLETMRHSLLS